MNPLNTANQELIKKMNTIAILNVIRTNNSISRADIAKLLKLNPATVSSNVSDLIDIGLIKEIGSGSSSGGRKPILLTLNADQMFIMGVHTELTHVNIGLMNMNGEMIYKTVYPYSSLSSPEAILDTIKNGIRESLRGSGINDEKILGIGVGLHGLVDSSTGHSVFAPAFHWHNIPIGDIIYTEFQKTTVVDNDVRVMALGEKWFGKAKNSDSFMLINVGEGIGGALFIGGKLYNGRTFGAGEIGHIKVSQKPLLCDCGNKGCLTTVASEVGIIRRMEEFLSKYTASNRSINYEGPLTFKQILDAADAGDKRAVELLKQTGEYLGRGIGIVINLINPEQVLLTGTVLSAKKYLMPDLIKAAETASLFDNFAKTKISTASIDRDLGVIGAATLILDDLFSI